MLSVKEERSEDAMSDIQIIAEETAEQICDNFCEYRKTITEDGCQYCREHDNKCPFDRLLKVVGL